MALAASVGIWNACKKTKKTDYKSRTTGSMSVQMSHMVQMWNAMLVMRGKSLIFFVAMVIGLPEISRKCRVYSL